MFAFPSQGVEPPNDNASNSGTSGSGSGKAMMLMMMNMLGIINMNGDEDKGLEMYH